MPACSDEDDGIAKVRVTPTSGLSTTEAGGEASFEVVLTTQPSDPVIVQLHSTRTDEGRARVQELIFTPDRWNVAQRVVVQGVDDPDPDKDVQYQIVLDPARSLDLRYQGVDVPDVTLENLDDDTPGFRMVGAAEAIDEGGSQRVAVTLASRPTGEVRVSLTTSSPEELSVPDDELVFAALAWDQPQYVVVHAVDDRVADGTRKATLVASAKSSDINYHGLVGQSADFSTTDNDLAGLGHSGSDSTIDERKHPYTFTIEAASEPSADVIIWLTASEEGVVVFSPERVVLGPGQSSQTVTVTGVGSHVAGPDRKVTIGFQPTYSSEEAYNKIQLSPFELTVIDVDRPGLNVRLRNSWQTQQVCEGSFNCCRDIYVSLLSEPTAPVTVNVKVSNPSEATVTPSVSIEPWYFDGNALVRVCGVADGVKDGDQLFQLTWTATSADGAYAALPPVVMDFVNLDGN